MISSIACTVVKCVNNYFVSKYLIAATFLSDFARLPLLYFQIYIITWRRVQSTSKGNQGCHLKIQLSRVHERASLPVSPGSELSEWKAIIQSDDRATSVRTLSYSAVYKRVIS